ncbi:DUF5133 domain-containing protein [Streptomyces sp. NPDC004237]|uniref:DUF5133 domain-containing protein n=1 Tax=Streptomyces sp. NPDC004237 TaxID=3154455 RepID=UPI0033BD50EE
MMMPEPVIPGTLVGEFRRLFAGRHLTAFLSPDRRPRDLAHPLCVITGTRNVRIALQVARRHLRGTTALVPSAETERPR